MRQWPLKDAKTRLGELIRRAECEGPQGVAVCGRTAAVLLSEADYARLAGRRDSLAAFLAASPLAGLDLDLRRDEAPIRPARF
ncbi:type II toxin-antitoxin system prevent-host-death family antitoxin [Shumkonia mesophila]|uniref:type II toxin-antitoxin system prevent-host-death family antitoxin n=1 Tax=Shumkonia mesophila TaxID=2838854 RepID=UPI0029342DB0|nr:type II toxin-antitoxin system prevent-host-death family antitoxin [Shumkonia mesophila]